MTATWTAPRTWVAAEVPDKAMMDQFIRDNQEYLKESLAAFDSSVFVLDSQSSIAGVPNVGTAKTALMQFAVPADTLAEIGTTLRVTATGRTAANANQKQLILGWGAIGGPSVEQPLDTGLNITWGSEWRVRAWIRQATVGSQFCSAYALYGAAAPAAGYQSADRAYGYQDEGDVIRVALDGGSNAGANQIWAHSFLVELLRAPA